MRSLGDWRGGKAPPVFAPRRGTYSGSDALNVTTACNHHVLAAPGDGLGPSDAPGAPQVGHATCR